MLRVADSYPSAGVSALGVVASAPVRRSLGAGSLGRRAESAGVSAPGVVASAPVRRSLGAESRGRRAESAGVSAPGVVADRCPTAGPRPRPGFRRPPRCVGPRATSPLRSTVPSPVRSLSTR